MEIVYGLFSAIPEKLWGTTRQLPDSYPTVARQLPHNHPTSGKSVVRNRETDALDKRDYGHDRIERQKQFLGTLPISSHKAEFGRAYLPGKSETSPAEISSYR